MIVLSGADLVLADRILGPGTLILDGDRIVDIVPGTRSPSAGTTHFDLHNHYVVPGFIDVHVHGVEGHDSLDGAEAVAAIASRLPRHGVTAFCPTTVACSPAALRTLLAAVRDARTIDAPRGARVLRAHLESNFISPEYRGAQPAHCLRAPRVAPHADRPSPSAPSADDYRAEDIVAEIERAREDIGIVTLAPELDGALELTRRLVAQELCVSLGHSGATFEEGLAAIEAGARHATHLFNRMPPLTHRNPGLVGAILARDEVAAEVICDGFHVHPAMLRIALAAKHPKRAMAITDGTAAVGLPIGTRARLGDQAITVRPYGAYLDDNTLAGSVATMEKVFGVLVNDVGLTPLDAATLCSTTPARELGLEDCGVIARGGRADLTVLDQSLTVTQTYVGGQLVFSRDRYVRTEADR